MRPPLASVSRLAVSWPAAQKPAASACLLASPGFDPSPGLVASRLAALAAQRSLSGPLVFWHQLPWLIQ